MNWLSDIGIDVETWHGDGLCHINIHLELNYFLENDVNCRSVL